jgi:hypothetical protein
VRSGRLLSSENFAGRALGFALCRIRRVQQVCRREADRARYSESDGWNLRADQAKHVEIQMLRAKAKLSRLIARKLETGELEL